jgi:hypothetical protein
MATSAQYAAIPKIGSALLTTADTSLTAPTTVGTVFTAGSNGSRIDYIDVQGVATTVASIVNIFIFDGTNYFLYTQIPVQAITSSTTAVAFQNMISSNTNANILPINLPTGYSVRATTSVTQTGVRVIALGGDY